MIRAGRVYRVTLEDAAHSAAYLIAVIHDRSTGFNRWQVPAEFADALRILQEECESLGLLKQFKRNPDGSFDVWPEARAYRRSSNVGNP